jgi:hypothetical protein
MRFPPRCHFFRFFLPQLVLLLLLALPAAQAASFIANPSFESNYNPAFPSYGPIDNWTTTGGSGVNQSNGPFHNPGTPIPDSVRVAFLQGTGALTSSPISGLVSGQRYWIQFFYDARNCCGGSIDLSVRWNGAEVDKITGITASTGGNPYKFRNIPIVASAATGSLAFATTATGDATLVLDGVTLAQRDTGNIVIMNPGFEASGDAAGAPMAGWTVLGTAGVNRSPTGTFADNGAAPEQDHVAYLRAQSSSLRQTLTGLSQGSSYAVSVFVNARTGNTPRLRISAGGSIISEADAASGAYVLRTANFIAAGTSALLEFTQIAAGDQVVLLDDVKVTGIVEEPLPCLGLAPLRLEMRPLIQQQVSVTVPQRLLDQPPAGGVNVVIRSPNPLVARIPSGIDDVITLTWQNGDPLTKSFLVEAVNPGSVSLEVLQSATLCVDRTVSINVTTQFIRNPSFELDGTPSGVGYFPGITAWTSNSAHSGLNRGGMPFLDNGTAPDRDHVGFLQGNGILSQTVNGLTPGSGCWLQLRYNARNGGSMSASIRFGGVAIGAIPPITPVGGANPFYSLTIPFTPVAESGLLEIETSAVGDATLLLDAITIVPRTAGEIVLQNPSFDAAARTPGVGYMNGLLAGWTLSGGAGLNSDGVGPFTDNGDAPDQEMVFFLQGSGYAAQNLSGFIPGQTYTLAYSVNARNCCTPGGTPYQVSLGGTELVNESILPVGGGPYYRKYRVFTAASAAAELRFSGSTPAGQDHTLLLDDIRLIPGDADPGNAIVPLTSSIFAGNSIRLAWPASAPAGMRLQRSTILTSGSWLDVTVPAVIEGAEFSVYEPMDDRRRFYRLLKP